MNHEDRRAKGRTTNNKPTLTDQSQATDTNVNVILKKYGITGKTTGTTAQPEYLDHSLMPQDLREAFEMARQARGLRNKLPEALRDKTLEELTALTPEELKTILEPPAPPPAPKEEPPK